MRNVGLVVKHEILSTIGKRSFWIMTIVFPLVILGLNVATQIVARTSFDGSQGTEGGAVGGVPVGYVDLAGVVTTLPPGMPENAIRAFADEGAAHAALDAGTITRYYVIPPDWMETGNLLLVDPEFNPLGTTGDAGILQYVLNYNLVGDERMASLVIDPTPLIENQAMAPEGATDANNPLTFLVPFATLFIFFFLLTMSGGFMLQSVAKEKENRTVEVLLLSLRPRELMLGKVMGLGLVALLQMAVWLGVGLLALRQGRQVFEAATTFELPPGFIVWAILYFLAGYLLYASVLGAIGAMAPSIREGTQFTFVVLLPLMIPLWTNVAFTQAPNGGLATFLSLFPLTAPTAMATRLSTGVVPSWQPVVGLAGLAATAYVAVLLAARFFRSETLLSGAGIRWKWIVQELRG